MDSMSGLVAIVTGASRGLGRAIAEAYAQAGARVVVGARRCSPTGLAGTAGETVEAIRAAGGEAIASACDVTDERQVADMVEQTLARYRRIDVLCNNAGMMSMGETIGDIEPDRWDEIMRINTRGPYLCCRAVLPTMVAQRRGSIVNVGSRAGRDPGIGGSVAYGASKAALHMFTFCLAGEVREHNIAVNVLNPGPMRSEGSAAIPWTQRDWHQRVEPSEVAPCAVFLALQDARSFTGQLASREEFGKTWGAQVP